MQRPSGSVIPSDDYTQYHALFDPVTELPRWALLLDRTEVAIARAQRVNRKVAVFVFDGVQTFSGAMPDFGRFANSLRSKVRNDDTIARVAEQTFVVVCNSINQEKDAAVVAQRLVQHNDVTCRLGIALSSVGDDATSLLGTAVKQAMRASPAA